MIPPDLIPGSAPLSSVPGLNPTQVQALNDLWIDSAQQLVGIYGTTNQPALGWRPRSESSGPAWTASSALAQRLEPRSRSASARCARNRGRGHDYPLGALLEDPAVTAMRMAAPAALYVVRCAARFPSPTACSISFPRCAARASARPVWRTRCLSVREQLEIAAGAPARPGPVRAVRVLVVQRARWAARSATARTSPWGCAVSARPGRPSSRSGRTSQTPTADQGQGPPPAEAAAWRPRRSRTAETQEFSRSDIAGMKACLVEGRSIAFSLPVFDSWFKSSAMARWGKITMPLPGETVREGHAMAIVGYQDDPRAPGGGLLPAAQLMAAVGLGRRLAAGLRLHPLRLRQPVRLRHLLGPSRPDRRPSVCARRGSRGASRA